MIRGSNNHKLLDKVMLILFTHVNTFFLQVFEGPIHDFNAPLNNQSPSVKFSLGLLDEQEGLGHFGMVSHFHDLHLLDVDSTDIASFLEEASHVVTDQGRICHQAGLIASRSVCESGADCSQHFHRLVVDVRVVVLYSVLGLNSVFDSVVYDT